MTNSTAPTVDGVSTYSEMHIKQVPLAELLAYRWEDNPKQHQDDLLGYSFEQYGFNDPVELDAVNKVLVAGHGRLGKLKAMKDEGKAPPKRVNVREDGEWLVPCVMMDFEDKNKAYLYALMNNRAGVKALDLRDYDSAKLSRALKKARDSEGRIALPGFGQDEIDASAHATGGLEIPSIPSFDTPGSFNASALPDAAGYQAGQVTQSFVAMITAPTLDDLRKIVKAITGGARTSLPDDTKLCSIEGMKFLALWEQKMLGDSTAIVANVAADGDVLPGQFTLAGDIVRETPVPVQLMPGMDNAELAVPFDMAVVRETPAIDSPKEPDWKHGFCPDCGGSGHKGFSVKAGERTKIVCMSCEGAGERDTWLRQHGMA